VSRETAVTFQRPPDEIENNVARWRLKVPASEFREILNTVSCRVGSEADQPATKTVVQGFRQRREAYHRWEKDSTCFESSNDIFDEALRTCIADFHALQIPDGDDHIVAAGIPWFATMFGRDSLIAAYQSLLLNPRLAGETLRVLARYQGKQFNDWLDEEPGKIPHEYRTGEMTRAGEMPFGPYYGSVDATPLFLILLSETFNWTGDEKLVRELLPAARAALDWIEKYGDLDGDGFVEYKRRSPKGLTNQGWKDSWDANMHRDGSVADPPIALVEVQGYCYEAQYRMAQLLRHFGDSDHADRLRKSSADLAKKIEKSFWLPAESFYAMGLDNQKRPLEVISSNPGHLLWMRLVSESRAAIVARRLMADDMYTGWGVRTLASGERLYNPMSYHNGSVWPHDNALIGLGLARYGHCSEALELTTALFDAAAHMHLRRLPELFCGFERQRGKAPTLYPVACAPQAWASATPFTLLEAALGLEFDAERGEIRLRNPRLPAFLDEVILRELQLADASVDLRIRRHGDDVSLEVLRKRGQIQVSIVLTH